MWETWWHSDYCAGIQVKKSGFKTGPGHFVVFFVTQSCGSIDPGQGGLYKYDQGPIFPSMTPALRQTCLFGRQKTEICGSWNFSGNGPYGKIQTKQECSDLPQDYLAI